MKKKDYTEAQACNKAEAYCIAAERCMAEAKAKLEQWGMEPEAKERILAHLKTERYIDEQRYCNAFIRDKYRFNQWGRIKIAQALRMKQIDGTLIEEGLACIDEEEYRNGLSELLAQKRKNIKGATEYERNGKLIRFAAGRGYETEEIVRCLKHGIDTGYGFPE